MQRSFGRYFLGLGAFYLALGPLSAARAQLVPRSYPTPRSSQNSYLSRGATLQGVVTTRRDNNEFDLRVGGATFRVRSASNVNVRSGDSVVVRGSFRNNDSFDAQTVRLSGANADNGYSYDIPSDAVNSVDFPAVVTRIISRREIEVRGDNNRIYRVVLLQDSGVLRVGSRVRVRGEASGTRIINARLLLQGTLGGGYYGGNGNYGDNGSYSGNGGYNSNGSYGGDYYGGSLTHRVDFPGRIVRLDTVRNEATVRGDNGRDYIVRGTEVDGFRIGDRVRVRGQASGDVVELDHLDLVL